MTKLKDLVLDTFRLRRKRKRPSLTDPVHHNSRENMDQFYGDDETVERYLEPARIAFYAEVVDFVVSRGVSLNGRRMLDAGCGTGHLLLELQRQARPSELWGLDFSHQAVQRTRQFCPDVHCQQHDLYEPLGERFDVVFCLEVLEHLLHPARALRNLLAATREPGTLVLTVPNGRCDTYEGHINFWSPESWQVFLSDFAPSYRQTLGLLEGGRVNVAILNGNT
jgi:2-polyprenyl-3-methyl-5-hydroxy-6-metoxy-1,4-benzoquinol methylase